MYKSQIKNIKLVAGIFLVILASASAHSIIRWNKVHADGSCTVTASSLSAIATDAASASPGATVCVAGGTYDGELTLSAHPSSDIAIQPVPGDTVTFTNSDHNVGIAVDFAGNAQHIILHNFYVTSEINLEPGASNITIDHNDVTGGYFGISGGSVNCEAPNAPVYVGCVTAPVISNITISGNRVHDFGYDPTNTSGIDWPIDHQTPAPANSEDALHFNNFNNLHITANEITGAEEGGNHTDCLQTVWGGSNLTFDHNYEHDNQCQGFFLKDGDVSSVSVTDNLFVRDYAETYDQNDMQVINASPITITNNVFWESQGNVLRAVDSSFSPSMAAVNHNLFTLFNMIDDSGPPYQLTEDYDIFKNDPFSFVRGTNSTIVNSPDFTNTSTDNYQLVSNPNGIGVDWQPSEYTYGPLATSPDSGSDSGSSSSSGSSDSSVSATKTVAAAKTPNKPKALASSQSSMSGSTAPVASSGGNLAISDIKLTNVTQNSAIVTWHTDQPASSMVRYGQDSNLNMSATMPGSTIDHKVELDSNFLKPGLQYSVQASSADADGHQATSQTISFQTDGLTLFMTVTDSAGKPASGATATIASQTQLTNDHGQAKFTDLPYGSYTATIVYKGQTTNLSVKVIGNLTNGTYKPQTLSFKLAAAHKHGIAYGDIAVIVILVILIAGGGLLLHKRRSQVTPPPTSF